MEIVYIRCTCTAIIQVIWHSKDSVGPKLFGAHACADD